ncbi:MAG: hypothetical protein ACKPKO_47295, partial [Candidatus Fonsibacter sp.]
WSSSKDCTSIVPEAAPQCIIFHGRSTEQVDTTAKVLRRPFFLEPLHKTCRVNWGEGIEVTDSGPRIQGTGPR